MVLVAGRVANRQDSRDQVVKHHAESALDAAVGPGHRPGFEDVEQAEQQKSRHRHEDPRRKTRQRQPDARHLVENDGRVVTEAAPCAETMQQPCAGNDQQAGAGDLNDQRRVRERYPPNERAEQGAIGAGRAGKQADAETRGDENIGFAEISCLDNASASPHTC